MISTQLQALGYNTFLEKPFSSQGSFSPLAVSSMFPEGSLDGPLNTYARFTTDIVFSATDNDTAAWTQGTINLFNGDITETIAAGNTGNITATTFVYYDAASKGILSTSTAPKDAIGTGKTLLAIVEKVADATKKCKVTPVFATGLVVSDLTADNIQAGSITANEIEFNYAASATQGGPISEGFLASGLSAVALPTTGIRIDSNGIYGRASGVTTFSIDAATGNATFIGTITSSTITGGTIRTASSGARVEITGSDNMLRLYNGSDLETFRIDTNSLYLIAGGTQSPYAQGFLIFRVYDSGFTTIATIDSEYALTGDWTGYNSLDLTCTTGAGATRLTTDLFYVAAPTTYLGTTPATAQGTSQRLYVHGTATVTGVSTLTGTVNTGGALNVGTDLTLGSGSGNRSITLSSGSTRTLTITQLMSNPAQFSTNGNFQFLTDGVSRMGVDNTGVDINGTLTKTSGSFDIPHPDPEKRDMRLRHYFVESPTAGDNIYRFRVNVVKGFGNIDLPGYFHHLNDNAQVWVNGPGHGRAAVRSTTVEVEAEDDGVYDILVIGTRKDEGALKPWNKYGVEYNKKNINREG